MTKLSKLQERLELLEAEAEQLREEILDEEFHSKEKEQRTYLTYHFGTSNKFYIVLLEKDPLAAGWRVCTEYGRVGADGNYSYKIIDSDFATAKALYDKIVRQKLARGYRRRR